MSSIPLCAFTDGTHWRPGIGDPTLIGWLTVVAYGFAALLAGREAWREWEERPLFYFWGTLCVLMILLGINKQLDLQTWFTLTGRKIARSEGWYGNRRLVQLWFIIAIAASGAAGFGAVWKLVQDYSSSLWLPLLGLFLVICFVIIRAASFHHIDEFLQTRLAGFKMNWLLELGGIGLIVAGALRADAANRETLEEPSSLQDA